MKAVLILFASFIFTVSPLMLVQADESQLSEDNVSSEQVEDERTDIDSSADSIVDRSADAKSLFEGRCQMCHQLPEPGMLRPKQWKLILTTMQQRMQQAGVPQLTGEETEMILEYIAEQSR
jgi:cytochrome c5